MFEMHDQSFWRKEIKSFSIFPSWWCREMKIESKFFAEYLLFPSVINRCLAKKESLSKKKNLDFYKLRLRTWQDDLRIYIERHALNVNLCGFLLLFLIFFLRRFSSLLRVLLLKQWCLWFFAAACERKKLI